MTVDLDERDYLRRLELLARDLVSQAHDEGWLSYERDHDDATPLQRTINEIARSVRHYHFEGDGCLEERPSVGLGGAALIKPKTSADDVSDEYQELCERLGVAPRLQGWALWHTWDNKQRAHTIVTTCLTTTRGMLANWSRGISSYPARPDRTQIAAVTRGWIGPIIVSPNHAKDLGLDGA
ncbi:hypothetical protein ACFVH6_45345 [Spirillospora sp. NPDC127200]